MSDEQLRAVIDALTALVDFFRQCGQFEVANQIMKWRDEQYPEP